MLGIGDRLPARPGHSPEFKTAYKQASDRLTQAGKTGSVLVRLDIDADGRVVSSRAIDPPWIARLVESKQIAFVRTEVILLDGGTGKRLPGPPPRSNDPEVRQLAAEVAARLTFTPASRRGRARITSWLSNNDLVRLTDSASEGAGAQDSEHDP